MTKENRPSMLFVIRYGVLSIVLINLILVGFGAFLVPTALTASKNGLSGLIASLMILLVYAIVSVFGLKRTVAIHEKIPGYSLLFGTIIGFLYSVEIILEYIILPNNQLIINMGKIEFGLAFLLFSLSGLFMVLLSQKFLAAVLTTFWCSIIASLIWLCVVLIVFYLFFGTAQQHAVLTTEGDYDDFVRSGMTDFNAFIIQDFWGAGFFHLLISPIIALILGSLGGLAGLSFLWFYRLIRGFGLKH